MEKIFDFSNIAGIASFISVVFGIIDHISKYANDFRSKRKPRFFVYELKLTNFSDEEKKKKYQIKGRLVSKDEVEYESIKVGFIFSNHYWEREGKYYRCKNGIRDEEDYGTELTIEKGFSDGDTLKAESKDLKTGWDYSYEIEGKYVVKVEDESANEKNKKDENYKFNNYEYKEEDITKSLEIKANIKDKSNGKDITKEISLKPIKCPNIRTIWLCIYIGISTLAVFIGVISTLMLIYNWKSLDDDIGLKLVFIIYGVLIVLITVYFFVTNMKCVSQLIILIRMKKFGVPAKLMKNKISNKTLIPKTIEYMTGTEKVDNIDKILLV